MEGKIDLQEIGCWGVKLSQVHQDIVIRQDVVNTLRLPKKGVQFLVQPKNHQVRCERIMQQATHKETAGSCYRTAGFIAKHSVVNPEGLKRLI
jgi:hypothetical protein